MDIALYYVGDNTSRRIVKKVENELRAAIRSNTVITQQIYGLDETDHYKTPQSYDQISLYFVTTQGMKCNVFRTDLENVLQNDDNFKYVYILSPQKVDGLTRDDTVWDVIYDNTTMFKHINVDSFRWRYSFYASIYEKLYGTPSKDVENPEPADNYWRGLYKLSTFKSLNEIVEGARLIIESAEEGNMYAISYVGVCYLLGVVPFDVNEETGINLIKIATKMGNPLACALYGKCRFYGTAIEQDYRKAYILLKMGAETDDANVFELLGQAYHEGLGCQQDMKMAWEFFKKARARKILENIASKRRMHGSKIALWKEIAYNTETCF